MATFSGTPGNDFFDGGLPANAGADSATGGAGDDDLRGGAENDTLDGGADSDNIFGGGGNDVLTGGSGWDWVRYYGATAGVNVNLATGRSTGGAGLDTLSGFEAVSGSDLNDTLIGDTNNNDFEGGLGNDSIVGGGGNDRAGYWSATAGVTVNLVSNTASGANVGSDTLVGISGAVGSAFGDQFMGNAGDNSFEGGAGNDTAEGGAGRDFYNFYGATSGVVANLATGAVSGGGGDDIVTGFEDAAGANFDDSITGSAVDNSLSGGNGNDTLVGGDGNDYLQGDAGNDSIVGGNGSDTARYRFSNFTTGITANLTTGAVTGGGGNDTLSGIEHVTGTDFNDSLTGDGFNNNFEGAAGDDTLLGNGGGDFFIGGAGNDSIDGGIVLDRVNYVDGNSLSYRDSTAGINLNLSGISGDGSVGQGTAADGFGGTDTLKNVQFITGSNFNDSILGSSATIFEQFEGGAGNDTIDGGAITSTANTNRVLYQNASGAVVVDLLAGTATGAAGSDVITNFTGVRGSNFNDTIYGSNRADYSEAFEGRAGNDRIDGRGGFDYVRYDTTTAGINVNLFAGTAADGNGGVDALFNIEGVQGSGFNDTIIGDVNRNLLEGRNGNDTIFAGAGNDDLLGGSGNDVLFGEAGSDVLTGGAGSDTLDGGVVLDRNRYTDINTASYSDATSGVTVDLSGITGDGTVGTGTASDGLGGVDTLSNVNNIFGSGFNDSLVGSSALIFEQFTGGAGDDTIDGGAMIDNVNGDDNNRVAYDQASAAVSVNLALGTATGGAGNDMLSNINMVRGSNFGDSITGSARTDRSEIFEGRGGNDTIDGGAGFDIARFDNSTSGVTASLASQTAAVDGWGTSDSFVGIEGLQGSGYNDVLTGGNALSDALETFRGDAGNDTIDGGSGFDRADYTNSTTGATVTLNDAADGSASDGMGGTDVLRNIEAVRGSGFNDILTGNSENNLLEGRDGNDSLIGGAGDDTLDAGAGVDTVDGGLGSLDVLNVRAGYGAYGFTKVNATDTRLVNAATGENILIRNVESIDFTDGARSVSDILTSLPTNDPDTLVGTAEDDLIDGLGGNDSISGLGGDDTLIGGTGIDTLVGGLGNDVYGIDVAGDVVTEAVGEGIDQVNVGLASGTYVLAPNVENAVVTSAGALNLTGNALNNALTGNAAGNTLAGDAGNDTLDGGLGVDTLVGGDGNDVYLVNVATDVVTEAATVNSGVDQVNVQFTAAGTYTLAANVENAYIGNGQVGVNLTGNALNNALDGNGEANVINGGAGGDFLRGHGGNDTIDGGVVLDRLNYTDGNSLSYTSSTSGVVVNLTGISGDGSVGSGTASDGFGGTDVLRNVQFITGSAYNDSIAGSAALILEQFEGGLGNDTIDGGLITDTAGGASPNRVNYTSATSAVQVDLLAGTATGGAGNDTLSSLNQVRASAHNDTLLGSNALSYTETFEGRGGNDSIDGRGGFDMVRYDGATTGVVVNLFTGIAQDGQGGTDTITGIEGIQGTIYADALTGGNPANGTTLEPGLLEVFRGGAGNDTINGGQGYDRADYNTSTTGVTVNLGGDVDGSATDGLGGTDILTSIEAVRGSDFADVLNGSDTGAFESFEGGRGNDTIDGNGGTDRVDYANVTAGVNVNLSGVNGTATDGLGGTDTLRDIEWVRGSALNDTIVGSADANRLEGGAGNDSLSGGAGDDTLLAGTGQDTVDGGANDDTLVLAGFPRAAYVVQRLNATDVSLTSFGNVVTVRNVENFEFSDGTVDFAELVGNSASGFDDTIAGDGGPNLIDGLAGNDSISGLGGNDTLVGGLGNDTLVGGQGNDTFRVDVATDVIVEATGEGIDLVEVGLAAGSYTLGDNVENAAVTSTGAVGIVGNAENNVLTGNAVGNALSGNAGNDTLDGGLGNDTLVGGDGDDTYVVNVATDVVTEAATAGSGLDQVNVVFTAAGTYTLAANVENAFVANSQVGVNLTGNTGNNYLFGNDAVNMLTGGLGNDSLYGGGGNDTLNGNEGLDNLNGGAGNDSMNGGLVLDRVNYSDANVLDYSDAPGAVTINLSGIAGDGSTGTGTATDGQGGTDTVASVQIIVGSAGNDSMLGSTALIFEQFQGGLGDDTIDGGTITDLVNGTNGNRVNYTSATSAVQVDLLAGSASGGAGNDTLSNFNQVRGSQHNDTLLGSNSTLYTETFEGRAGNDSINGRGGIDVVRYDSATVGININLQSGIGSDGQGGVDTLSGIEGIRGSAHNDTLTGGNPANGTELSDGLIEFFRGDAGNDQIDGGQGYDRADYNSAMTGVNVTLGGTGTGTAADGLGGTDTLTNIEAVRGSDFADLLTGSSSGAFESFEGGRGNDTIDGDGGTDRADYAQAGAGVNVNISVPNGTATDGFGGTDTLRNIEWVRGSAFNDTLLGSSDANRLEGGAGNDSINGGAGEDTLYAGTGVDTVDGGLGDDTLVFAGDQLDYTVTRPNATDVVFTRAGESITARGVEQFSFSDGVRTLGQVVGNAASAFNDDLTGTAGDDSIDGLAGNDSISGLGGNDTLVGGLGNDTLVGGQGNDTFRVDVATDVVVEATGEGIDLVEVGLASGTYTLGDNVENGTVTSTGAAGIVGNAGNNVLTGNAVGNALSGNAGNDTLDGGLGNDTLAGGDGDDLYVVNIATDVVTEAATVGSGLDSVNVAFTAAGTYTLAANVENATITTAVAGIGLAGNASANMLTGNALANALTGAAGDDTLEGMGGNDTLDGGVDADTVVLAGSRADYALARPNATDLVLTRAGESVTLRNIESFQFADGTRTFGQVVGNTPTAFNDDLTGTAGDDSIDGLAGNDSISGLGGNDTLVGGLGNDTLVGGQGNDTFRVDVATDLVVEAVGEGTDLVEVGLAAGSYTLGDNVENGTVTSTGAAGIVGNAENNVLTGNAVGNALSGNAGNDTLDGGLGNDTLAGGDGDDLYVVNIATDVVTEATTVGSGLDQVNVAFTAAGTYTLAANVENATITTAVAGIGLAGNASANMLTGNALANALTGAAGNDMLDGAGGNDTLDGGADADTAVLAGARADYTVSRPNATDVVLTGFGQIVTLRGIETIVFADVTQSYAQLIDGSVSTGNDVLTGTAGDDSIDGLAGNDSISGLGGNDTLVGGLGNDTLVGGQGNDTFRVDVATDVVVEATGEGIDLVEVGLASGTYTLGDNVENGTVTSTGAAGIVGNAENNVLTGNAVGNALIGNAGNDTLDGGLGNDTLAGGDGNDTYVVNIATDVVTEAATVGSGTDSVNVAFTAAGTYTLAANVENATITASLNGVNVTGNTLANTLTGGAGNNIVSGGTGNDTLAGGGGNDTVDGGADSDTLVFSGNQADYAITRPVAGQVVFTGGAGIVTALNVESVAFADGTFAMADLIAQIGSSGNDTLTGTSGADTLDGAGGNDTVSGLGGDDTLWGGLGNDRLVGGQGNDFLDGGAGSDTYVFGDGDGDDVIQQNDTLAGSIDVLELTHAGLTLGDVVFSRGYYDYDDLVVNVLQGIGDAQTTEKVVVANFFANDVINSAAAIDQIRITGGTATLADDVVLSAAQIANLALSAGDGDRVFVGYGTNDVINGGAGASNDWIRAGGGNDTVNGLDGDDIAFGGAGSDSLSGGAGADLLVGGEGNDILRGGLGNDSLSGGAGNDTYLFAFGDGQDVISEALFVSDPSVLDSGVGPFYAVGDGDAPRNADTDVLGIAAADTAVSVVRSGENAVFRLNASSDQVTVKDYFANGTPTIETVSFSNGVTWSSAFVRARVTQSTNGDDELTGYLGGDRLSGGSGNDVIDGRQGNDTLMGGQGMDLLTGGAGSDRFVFDTAPGVGNVDTITDFQSGVDTIALSASLFGTLGAAGARVGLSANLSYDSGTGALAYDVDGAGGTAAVQIAVLGVATHPAALGADFLLI